jgi:hypothetical protein
MTAGVQGPMQSNCSSPTCPTPATNLQQPPMIRAAPVNVNANTSTNTNNTNNNIPPLSPRLDPPRLPAAATTTTPTPTIITAAAATAESMETSLPRA